MPNSVRTIYARVDSGLYCWEVVQAYEKKSCRFILVARKTARLLDALQAGKWKRSPRTDADGQCELFRCQPEGWGKAYRFLALRYEKNADVQESEREQHQLFELANVVPLRRGQAKPETLKHTTLAIARLRFLFLAAKIWRRSGRIGISYSGERTVPAD